MTDSINTSHAAESQCLLTALLIKALYFVFISLSPPLPLSFISLSPRRRAGLNWILNDPEPIEQFLLPYFHPPSRFKNSPHHCTVAVGATTSPGTPQARHPPPQFRRGAKWRERWVEERDGGEGGVRGKTQGAPSRPLRCRKWENWKMRDGVVQSLISSRFHNLAPFSLSFAPVPLPICEILQKDECDCCSHLSFISPGRTEIAAFCVISNTGLYKTASIGARTIQGRFTSLTCLPCLKITEVGVKEHLFSMLMWIYCLYAIVFSELIHCVPK